MTPTAVVFATDFSDAAENAAIVARDYARRLGARLYVFHVLAYDEYDVTTMLRAQADIAAPIPVTVASSVGDPAEEIVRYAAHVGARLIVLGTHGRSGVSRALLGSVTERVLRTAPCPVLAVPMKTSRPAARRGRPAAPSRCIVCSREAADLMCATCRARIREEDDQKVLLGSEARERR